mmetsp:Transcript_224/g.335  ORF Transcript_224/g.335 Transcript_224/m.335 type:complete len:125 (+) Transcript_224:127-501(+)|eukprot:CAMPEP_0171452802 /NCGR_PEP_ID=MMETSP0945-20130129/762_1 /TAXON_ID=109269 /ORGANISM="Vaucheria litorea, Strain CCMP2940" /LENGTH=124 /DNA_ID=CAMNT_0011977537 /DNA_START=77 /DNA_END=451 /DNA_ORIENTATION=-
MSGILGGLARRSVVGATRRTQQVRQFGHGHVEYTGAEATLRKYLPEDHHIVLANLGAVVGIYAIYKMTQIGKKPAPEPAAPAAAPSASDAEIPSLLDEGFEEFAKVPGNIEKWEKSVEEWANAK